MKKIIIPVVIIASAFLSSCGGENHEAKETEKNETVNQEEICFFEYDKESSATVKWTAFKTSDKVAVGGTFNTVLVKAGEKSTKLPEVLRTITFTIPTKSTNTTNPDRDAKIVNSFFGNMLNTDLILGHVKSVEGDNESGTMTFYLMLNDIEKEVALTYTATDNIVKLTGEIDINNWNAETALKELNNVCGDLHKGADGVSVTWPNVELEIEAKLSKRCH
ncbi:MAG: YceI family protein [Flavobacteriales bacterium]|nr:YceI family protein [Flavobacteriales bacterium]MCB9364973.1 YceI family protein [Flavobacteriales bacterium]